MKEFAEELQKYITGKNRSALAREAAIDRSLLQKMIRGVRNPSSEAMVVKLGQALMLSPANQEALLEAYRMDAIGLGNYNRHQLVKELFEVLSPPPHSTSIFLTNYYFLQVIYQLPACFQIHLCFMAKNR